MSEQTTARTVSELASLVGGRVIGDGNIVVERVSSLERAEAGACVFVEDRKMFDEAQSSRASCLIVPPGTREKIEREKIAHALIEVAHPKFAFALVAAVLHPPKRRASAIHPTANVAASASVDEGAYIGERVSVGERTRIGAGTQILAGTIIGDDVCIGRECVMRPNVVLYDGVQLGDRVILHAGVVVGADGFGYVRDETGYHKFPQIGMVFIEDDVEIGAQTCVDRGALGETRIGRGTKIDNLVQIGHNVRIGERVVIAAQTGVSGSTVIEDDAVIGGQVGFGDHARVERGAIIGSKAGVLPGKIVRAGTVMWGVPVRPLDEYKRLNAHFGRLPQMREELTELRRQVRELIARLDDKLEE